MLAFKMVTLSSLQILKQHLNDFFEGHASEEIQFNRGPMIELAPWFRVIRFAPGPHLDLWSYVSVGASTLLDESNGLEFAIFAEHESPRYAELVTMMAHYHSGNRLGVGHTVPLGEPWFDGSLCNASLISLPYPLGNEFEVCPLKDSHIHILWMVPITESERQFKIKNGLDALEDKFEEAELRYWDFSRQTIV